LYHAHRSNLFVVGSLPAARGNRGITHFSGVAQSNTVQYAHVDTYSYSNTHRDRYLHRNIYPDIDADEYTYIDCHGYDHAFANPYHDTDEHTDQYACVNQHPCSANAKALPGDKPEAPSDTPGSACPKADPPNDKSTKKAAA